MDGFRVDPAAHVPPSVQIVEAVLDALAAGRFAPGARLPSVRAMAVEVLVNPNTVGKAYAELERLGVVAGRNGSGVFVTEDGPVCAGELRHAATLAAFVEASRAALRAGHAVEVLASALDASSAESLGEETSRDGERAVRAGDRDARDK